MNRGSKLTLNRGHQQKLKRYKGAAGARVSDRDQILRMLLRSLLRHKAQEEPENLSANKREQGRYNHVERLSHTFWV